MSTQNFTLRTALVGLAAITVVLAGSATSHADDLFEPADRIDEDTTVGADDGTRLLAACPLDGPATFDDSWGWPRSGGRRHEGVDMIADRGTAVIAVRDGFAEFKNSNLGGRAVWLSAPDGDRFYYAHLDAWEGESREVVAGELIGYVGSTGNAGGPHLHFETHPGGTVENPYPFTLGACVPSDLGAEPLHDRDVDPLDGGDMTPASNSRPTTINVSATARPK